jgi:4-hydroxy-tetrahydrodipicolinate synthase
MQCDWKDVFPAITTQMTKEGEIDLAGTIEHLEVLIESGIAGVVILGSLGENQTMSAEEKRSTAKRLIEAVNRRIYVLSGVAESSTRAAVAYTRDVEAMGIDGVMLMPAMSYRGDPDETMTHLKTVAASTKLPIMIYNNPISYFNDVTPGMFARLAEVPNLVAIKESSGDTRRITDIRNEVGERYRIFSGVDNLILESAVLGIDGWIAGSGIAFPKENQRFWELTRNGNWDEARCLYRWFTPLLHLDVHTKFIQFIKLMVQECGLGKEWVRDPRRILSGTERDCILKIIHEGIANRPKV